MDYRFALWGFTGWTLMIQICAAAAALALASQGVLAAATAASVVAFALARLKGLPWSWLLLNTILPSSLLATLFNPVAPVYWCGGALLLLLIFAPTIWTRVPYYPTAGKIDELIAKHLPEDHEFTFIDLGCGFGGTLITLARLRPNGKFYGVELGILTFAVSRLRALCCGNNRVQIRFLNIWSTDLGHFDYIYAFLAPPPMQQLLEKVITEAKAEATILINSFPFDAPARSTEALPPPYDQKLYTYVASDLHRSRISRPLNQ